MACASCIIRCLRRLGNGIHAIDADCGTRRVRKQAGVALAMLNTSQQIGAALGVSLLATFSTLTANGLLPNASTALQQSLAAGDTALIAKASEALAQGYTTAFFAGAGLLVVAAVVVAMAVNTEQTHHASAAHI